ncbi:CheR family methyltransferase [Haliovirga abyssi]|uniref:protein-glutamate O-methyltransferase n=1 Tax=Haliovirga abyssi TaxID=2996794 RepID=A0AAU9DHR9_9FUSO|nr:protein-glutamate O-methyltransferase CheR [Haliovirga abyssi]BDU50294.1 chemotaxis protein methyltransferase [Haliovirga abyssi]
MVNSKFSRRKIVEEKDDVEFKLEEFYTIRDFIYSKSGIYFKENKIELLRNRIIKKIKDNSFNSFKEYYYYLKYNSDEKEFKLLMDAITINETKFFRNNILMSNFEAVILPEILKEKEINREKYIKILSVGCSTGEEPYTIAMILEENKDILMEKGISYKIVAGDISSKALNSAKEGIYKTTQFRATKDKYIKKYFKVIGEGKYEIDFSLKSKIDFNYLNLADLNSLKSLGNFDIIFCRNVMIYFDNDFKTKLIKQFYEMLNENGYLFIGYSESLFSINNDFKLKQLNGSIVYKKEAEKCQKY